MNSSRSPSFDFPFMRSTKSMGISLIRAWVRCARKRTSCTMDGPCDWRVSGWMLSTSSLRKHRKPELQSLTFMPSIRVM